MAVHFIALVITAVILTAFGYGLSKVWDAGYPFLVAAVTPTILGVAYYLSSEEDRAEFRDNMARSFRQLLAVTALTGSALAVLWLVVWP